MLKTTAQRAHLMEELNNMLLARSNAKIISLVVGV
jgi:hypothetical protein